MSARKSFDIGTKRSAKEVAKAPVRRVPVRRRRRRTVSDAPKRRTLRERRAEAQQRTFIVILALAAVGAGIVLYVLWRPEIRISEVRAPGHPQETALAVLARDALEGTYWYVFPRDSFFFYPERAIKADIMQAYPNIQELSVSRTSFTSIELTAELRQTAFLWCGTPDTMLYGTTCYEADKQGYIYAVAGEIATTSHPLIVRAFIDTASSTDGTPVRGHVLGSLYVPEVLDFIQTIEALGVAVDSVAIRGDEADLFTPNGTRISYVIGEEKHAAKDARAALPQLNLSSGTIEYVDLRFPGKVYIKRSGEVVSEE